MDLSRAWNLVARKLGGILGLQKTVASLLAGAGILGLAIGFAFQGEVELFYEELAGSSVLFTVRFWIPFRKQADYLAARSEAIERLKAAFDAHGITMPFPTRTIDFNIRGGQTFTQILQEAGIAPVEGGSSRR